jgi:hypothetical protein
MRFAAQEISAQPRCGPISGLSASQVAQLQPKHFLEIRAKALAPRQLLLNGQMFEALHHFYTVV